VTHRPTTDRLSNQPHMHQSPADQTPTNHRQANQLPNTMLARFERVQVTVVVFSHVNDVGRHVYQ